MEKLPDSHISVDEAIKVIRKHTAKNPVIDLTFMLNNIRFMNSARNYTMKLLQKDKDGNVYSGMHVAIVVRTDRDLENLKYEIKEAYKRLTGKFVEPEKIVRKVTSQVDDKAGETSKLRVNTKSKAAFGDKIEKGDKTVEEV